MKEREGRWKTATTVHFIVSIGMVTNFLYDQLDRIVLVKFSVRFIVLIKNSNEGLCEVLMCFTDSS